MVESWKEAEERVDRDFMERAGAEIDKPEDDGCVHEGVECEPMLVCPDGCNCRGCREARHELNYGDPGTETQKL